MDFCEFHVVLMTVNVMSPMNNSPSYMLFLHLGYVVFLKRELPSERIPKAL